MDEKALFKISYGLYLLSARSGEKDNACIINALAQVTNQPNRIVAAVNKTSLTHDLILETGLFTASILSGDAPFSLFERFGFQSGRDLDKFAGFSHTAREENGLVYLTQFANAYLTGRTVSTMDLGTHTLFFADFIAGQLLSNVPSLTYEDYFQRVKPAPAPKASGRTGWRCRVCGYIYEGETLPPDFVCPWCKHGTADFERIEL
ncbi:MAG: flavin reductase [Oscillospiraceae bacterium]|jgi:flavin reductase (DIM6/NTAB) family NADH-FMN oxidoreductase RutF/rubredoxin|nr:flavin reductase [Oscillospiraceae bacterium]